MAEASTLPARRARQASPSLRKGNCFTTISDAAGLAKIAETLSEHRAIGRLSQVCERWIYTCVCELPVSACAVTRRRFPVGARPTRRFAPAGSFALDFDEQKRSGFRYQYSNYQIEYSRNPQRPAPNTPGGE
jgi:hypothetical protein